MADDSLEITNNSIPSESGRDREGLHRLGYIDDRELAAILNKTRRALWEDRRRRRGPAFITFGKQILYKVASVQRFLDSLEQPGQPMPTARTPRRVGGKSKGR